MAELQLFGLQEVSCQTVLLFSKQKLETK